MKSLLTAFTRYAFVVCLIVSSLAALDRTISNSAPISKQIQLQNNNSPQGMTTGSPLITNTYSISGTLKHCLTDVPIDSALIYAAGSTGDTTWTYSDSLGIYSLTNLPSGYDYVVRPQKSGGFRWTLSMYDGLILLKWVGTIYPLMPCQIIAGRGEGNWLTIEIWDFVWGIGLPPDSSVGHWRFIPEAFPLDENNYAYAPDSIFYDNLSSNHASQDYDAILMGDVSGNWGSEYEQATAFYSLAYDSLTEDTLMVLVNIDSTGVEPSFCTAELFFTYDSNVLAFADADFLIGLFSGLSGTGYRLLEEGRVNCAGVSTDSVSGHGQAFSLKLTYLDGYDFGSFTTWLTICSTRVEEEAFVFYSCCNGDSIRGNVDNHTGPAGEIDVADLTYMVAYLFQGGPAPPCIDEGNADGIIGVGGPIDVADLTYLVAYLFQGSSAPPTCP